MCGIGGILRRDGKPIPEEWLNAIDARVAYRGPDGAGRFTQRVEFEQPSRSVEIVLVHRRLSIIDHDTGAQPMISEQGKSEAEGLIAVAFNGCIYNHLELREQLESLGRRFVTDHSDTEVFIHGYREWGAKLDDRLEGMYAAAVWDATNGALVLFRDWFGEKPLFVRGPIGSHNGPVFFSSDAASIAQLSSEAAGCAKIPGKVWLSTYLQLGYNWSGRTVYQSGDDDAEAVTAPPLTITTDNERLMPARQRESHSQHEFEQLLRQAVHRRLEADVPLGCFLSGGVDSSLVACFAKEKEPDLRTFSVRMPDERYDESAIAEQVAEHLGTDHTTLDVAMNPAEDLVHLVKTLGQPFGDSSLLPTYWVSKAARLHVKVALTGDGGDELFLGYERYMAARHLTRHRRLLKWLPHAWLARTHPKSRAHKLGRLADMARDFSALGILTMESLFSQAQITALMGTAQRIVARQPPGRDPMQSLRRCDLQQYLPHDLLCKVDTASMAVALEVRTPFLDRALVQAALSAPTWQLAPNGRRKGLLRDIARKYVPQHIVDRPKMGFAIPLGEWFRNDFGGMRSLLTQQLQSSRPFGPFVLHQPTIDRLIAEHIGGERDHSQRLFALLTLSIWADHVIGCK